MTKQSAFGVYCTMYFLLISLLFSCVPEKVNTIPDSMGQFVAFEMDGKPYNWTESDSITFMPVIGHAYRSDKPDSIILNYFMKLSKAHPTGSGGIWYESIDMVFNQKWRASETISAPGGCLLLPTGQYHQLFAPASWNCIGWICEPSMKDRDVYLGMNLQVNNTLVSGSSAWDFLCDEQPLDQTGSYFRITSAEEYIHPQGGIFKILEGEFQMKIYLGTEMLPLKNGRFKVAMKECN